MYNLILFSILIKILNNSIIGARYKLINKNQKDNKKQETKQFKANVDNFDSKNLETFDLRYLTNDNFADMSKDNNPILFQTGNEGDIVNFQNNTGFVFTLAKEFNAHIIFVEHRYFGTSKPADELNQCSIDQALEDFANVLIDQKSSNNRTGKVVALGGSQGGMLSAWFRVRYSHLVDGALAGSAPVNMLHADRQGFNKIVYDDFTCRDTIRKTLQEQQAATDLDSYSKGLNLCEDLTEGNKNNFQNTISSIFSYAAMVNQPYSTSFLQSLPPNPVDAICKGDQSDNMSFLSNSLQTFQNQDGKDKCIQIEYTPNLGDLTCWDQIAATQIIENISCNEECLTNKYEFDKDAFNKSTMDTYDAKVDWTYLDRAFGSKFDNASNIIFSNGKLDPWQYAGITESENKNIEVIVIEGSAHHLDLRTPNVNDPKSVVVARQKEIEIIRKWIKTDEDEENDFRLFE